MVQSCLSVPANTSLLLLRLGEETGERSRCGGEDNPAVVTKMGKSACTNGASWVMENNQQSPVLSTSPAKTAVTETQPIEQLQKNQAAIRLLRAWREEGDEQEQKETWEYLCRVLDEDRLSNWSLFP